MSTHNLKIRTTWLDRIVAGDKRAEIRKHDRDYQVGDTLHLTEVDGQYGYPVTYPYDESEPESPDRGHRTVDVIVTHVLDGRLAEGIDDGYCVLSISKPGPSIATMLAGGAA
jgi:hypothetical protein